MSEHITFLKTIVGKNIYALSKDMQASKGGKKDSSFAKNLDCFIKRIEDEEVIMHGLKKYVKRVFISAADSGDLVKVGWVINSSVDNCMVCGEGYGWFGSAHHCKACGNAVCGRCSKSKALIQSAQDLGNLRVCDQCFWGQEIVELFIKESYKTTFKQANSSLLGISEKTSKKFETATIPGADKEAKMAELLEKKHQQQLEFQREARRRMAFDAAKNVKNNTTGSISVSASNLIEGVSINKPNNGESETDDQYDSAAKKRFETLSSYGLLTRSAPTPGFVIKTKRQDNTKVFVNICMDAQVPYRADLTTENENDESNGGAIDLNKLLYMALGSPREYVNEKDSSYCVIFDLVVHPDELKVCNLDSTGNARTRLCKQGLKLISLHYDEFLDPSYRVLTLKSNYKGQDQQGNLDIKPFVFPAMDAFYSLVQLATTEADYQLQEQQKIQNSIERDGLKGLNQQNSILSNRQSTNSVSSVTASMVTFFEAMEEEVKAIIVPVIRFSTAEKTDKKNKRSKSKPIVDLESRLLEEIQTQLENQREVGISDIIINPVAGFVVEAQRVNKGQKIFINVCHHPLVGKISGIVGLDGSNRKGKHVKENESSTPYIIGAVAEDVTEVKVDNEEFNNNVRTSSVEPNKALCIDVVVPRAVFIATVEDDTGDLRDELAVEILGQLTLYNINLDSNFSLPLVPGGYVGKNVNAILPVINLTEQEKSICSVYFIGKLNKQGHGVKTWKERLVLLHEETLKYYELKITGKSDNKQGVKINFKGNFSLLECSMENVNPVDCNAPYSEKLQINSYPFKLLNYNAGGEYMFCYVTSEKLRKVYENVISTMTRQMSILKSLINIPPLITGWLTKQGHSWKNWKKRFFVLSCGQLEYFEKDGQQSTGSGEVRLGFVDLVDCSVRRVLNSNIGEKRSNKDFRLEILDLHGHQQLLLQAESEEEKLRWFSALKDHVAFANNFNKHQG